MQNNMKIIQRYYSFDSAFPEHHLTYVQIDDRSESYLHYHNCIEIGCCVSGKGTMMINNSISSFESGTITIMNDGCLHDSHIFTQNKDEAKSVWKFIFIKPELVGVDVTINFAGFASNDSSLFSLFNMMYTELEENGSDYRRIFSDLFSAFLRYAERIAPKDEANNIFVPSSLPPEMVAAISNIHANYNSQLNLENMAQACNMSVSNFCRVFKIYFHIAPIAYLNNLRLTVAKQLLETTRAPVVEISTFVGYTTLSSFNRLFLNKFGCSPRELRKRPAK